MSLNDWREPTTKAFSCIKNPGDRSCDNAPLFTIEAARLGLISEEEAIEIVLKYEKEPGCIMRYPGATDFCSWDDHLAASSLSINLAIRVKKYGKDNGWSWNNDKLWRFPIFLPTVLSQASGYLFPGFGLLASLAFIANMFESKQETSGKLLLWLAKQSLYGKSMYLDIIMNIWAYVMKSMYGDVSEVFAIYFPAEHPFIEASKGKEF